MGKVRDGTYWAKEEMSMLFEAGTALPWDDLDLMDRDERAGHWILGHNIIVRRQ